MKNYLGKQILNTIFYPFLFLLSIWIVFFIEKANDFNFVKFGVLPRKVEGLFGIITSIFIHGDIEHIASNSIPLLVLGMMLFYFYKKIAKSVFIWIWLVSGIWLWLGGRNSGDHITYHIGASTLIYGLATFLFFSGVFRKHLRLMVVSAMVVFLYGSIMWGIFPLKTEISWEGHLFGSLAGILVAFNFRKEGPQRRIYQWEEEIEDDEAESFYTETEDIIGDEIDPNNNVKINFIYKEKDKES
ncbi:MAG: rhomboid family intramembrane serine protease [Bacteroidota bacterium]|nr:rhomboid family intramembrane serine protease [Bacteroidota bacterium]MDP3144314.1 rhomboid family intramembrane serine protease [Bacteroidota bacterium]MDP3556300.1 rhomboid family intramembrane serine protease [Bacteroidota bacterium]